MQPENVKLSLRLSQSQPLYKAFKALKESKEWDALSSAQRRIVDNELRDFVLGGVALEGEAKERFNQIQQDLAQLSTKFSNNVLDGTKAFKKLITSKEEVDGLPPTALALAAQQAKKEGHEAATAESGPWLFTLDFPSYHPVQSHCKNRTLREEMYKVRGSEGGRVQVLCACRLRRYRAPEPRACHPSMTALSRITLPAVCCFCAGVHDPRQQWRH